MASLTETKTPESKKAVDPSTVKCSKLDQENDGGSIVKCPHLGQENDEGSIEYKLKLCSVEPERLEHLTTQLNFRLNEGGNEALYQIGVSDDGTPTGISTEEMDESLATLEKMCNALDGTEKNVLRIREGRSSNSKCAEILIRRVSAQNDDKKEVRVAVIGNVDSGKSTLIGVLTKGLLDNGRGSARSQIFRHPHEIESGRTSSVSQQILGFSNKGEITNYKTLRPANDKEIVQDASKVVTFLDLAGHEAYLKTTIFGMVGGLVDYGMLLLGGNMGVQRMTKEHLSIALALNTPLFVVVTKVDIAPDHILKQNLKAMRHILKKGGRKPFKVRTLSDVLVASEQVQHKQIVPMFRVSNVTGEGLDVLKQFLNLLHGVRNAKVARAAPVEFYIDDTFSITGAGTVVAGTMYSGRVCVGNHLSLGPDFAGHWTRCMVKSIHCKQLPVQSVASGQSASFALRKIGGDKTKKITRQSIRKGMVMVDPLLEMSCREFEAEVLILHHPTTIKENYQPYCHIRTIRQSAQIMSMERPLLRTGDRTVCRFRFMYHPEYISVGTTMLFREGRTKGMGKITKLHPLNGDRSGASGGGGGGGGGGGPTKLRAHVKAMRAELHASECKGVSSENENVDEAFRINEKKKLENFRDGLLPSEEKIVYSNTLTNHERRYIHALAGQLGLVSKSYGNGATRYLTVRLAQTKD